MMSVQTEVQNDILAHAFLRFLSHDLQVHILTISVRCDKMTLNYE